MECDKGYMLHNCALVAQPLDIKVQNTVEVILIYQGVHCCTKVCYLWTVYVRVVMPPEGPG